MVAVFVPHLVPITPGTRVTCVTYCKGCVLTYYVDSKGKVGMAKAAA